MAPFVYILIFMSNNKDNNEKKRPRRMINVGFPSAKFGLYFAIIILVVCLFLIFFG